MKLRVKENKVDALLKTGDDFVKTSLNEMTAQRIIESGKVTKSDNKDYPICVNGEWYFAGEVEAEKSDEEPKKKAKK